MQVRLEFAPIMKMVIITAAVALVIFFISVWFESLPSYESLMTNSWILADLVHIPQFLIPFILICYITRGKIGEYGFTVKSKSPIFTHTRMLIVGIIFGLLMSLRYIPHIIRNTPPSIPVPITFVSILGNMTFQWIVVGLSEETMFRGLIQTYLMKRLEGTVEIFGRNLHIGTVIGALFWGGFHFINILVMPLRPVIFIVILTTGIGLLMGYAYQKSGSLLTTMIVHNMIFGVPLTIGYFLYWLL